MKTFLADYEKYLDGYNRAAEKIKSPMFQPTQLEKTEIDGTRGLKMTMRMPQMPNMPPESVKMMERMYGPGGKIVAWMVPCNEHTVAFSYMSPRAFAARDRVGQAGQAGPGSRCGGGQGCGLAALRHDVERCT